MRRWPGVWLLLCSCKQGRWRSRNATGYWHHRWLCWIDSCRRGKQLLPRSSQRAGPGPASMDSWVSSSTYLDANCITQPSGWILSAETVQQAFAGHGAVEGSNHRARHLTGPGTSLHNEWISWRPVGLAVRCLDLGPVQVIQSVDTQLKTCTERVVFEAQPVRATTHSSRATVVDLHGDGTETVAGFFVREEDLHQWLAAPAFAVSRAVDLEADISATETENPDGKVAVIDWLQPGDGSKIQCTTLHIITFDGRTRFAKVRNPVRVRAGYKLRVRLGDWAGHSPAYLSIVNAGFKDPRAEAAGVPPSNTCLWDFFDLVGAKLQAALGCACEVVVASPGVRKTSLVLCQRVQALTVRATKQQTQHTSILRDAPQRTTPTTSTSTAQQPLRQRERKQEQPEAQQEHQQEQDWQIAAWRSHLLKW